MKSEIAKLKQWETDLGELNIEKVKAESRLEQSMDSLKQEGFTDFAEAKKEAERRDSEKEEVRAEVAEAIAGWKVTYADFIE